MRGIRSAASLDVGVLRCANEEKYLHGPKVTLTKTVGGKTVLRTISKGSVELTKAQIGKFQQYQRLNKEFLAVNEQICEAKLRDREMEVEEAQKKTPERNLTPKSSKKSRDS